MKSNEFSAGGVGRVEPKRIELGGAESWQTSGSAQEASDVTVADIIGLRSLEDVSALVRRCGGIKASNGKLIPAEKMHESLHAAIKLARTPKASVLYIGALLKPFTSQHGLRDKVVKLVQEEWAKTHLGSFDTFSQIKEAVGYVSEFKGSRGTLSSVDALKAVELAEQLCAHGAFGYAKEPLPDLTNTYFLRTALYKAIGKAEAEAEAKRSNVAQIPATRVMPAMEMPVVRDAKFFKNENILIADRLKDAHTWEDIDLALSNCKGITGSKEHYNPFQLRVLVNDVRTAPTAAKRAAALELITSSEGLKRAVERVLG